LEIFPHFIGIYLFIYFLDQTTEEQLDASLCGDDPLLYVSLECLTAYTLIRARTLIQCDQGSLPIAGH